MAHKNILSARSTYFAGMFESGMKENLTNKVRVTDAQPEAFKALLKYIYAEIEPKDALLAREVIVIVM